jgi:O-methyltransferase involved in polyketide biosynthesis
MPNQTASRTALGTAYLRAAHQLFEKQPRILDDPVALSLLGPAALQRIKDTEARVFSLTFTGRPPILPSRQRESRYLSVNQTLNKAQAHI